MEEAFGAVDEIACREMMSNVPGFFVPAATSDNQESVYAELARWSHCHVPEPSRRIFSISFIHEGEEWTATVGERLKGTRRRISRIKGQHVERATPVSDPAIVLAIFSGSPFKVVTNHRIVGNVGSRWENPFMAGQPTSITYFTEAVE